MHRVAKFLALCSLAVPLCAADYQSGQAARAVIGQSSFSSRDAGITATALSISNGRLYAADAANRLLAFDLSQIPPAMSDFAQQQTSGCAVCGFSPIAVLNQSVIPGIAAAAVWGKSVAIADPANHRVLVWRDATSENALKRPDVIIGSAGSEKNLVNASTVGEPISVALDGQRLFVGDGALHRVLIWNSLPLTDNQPADVVLGQSSFTASGVPDNPGADTISRPVALESDGKNLYVADSAARRILVFTPADVPLTSNSLTNSATFAAGPLAPGTLVTVTQGGLVESSAAAKDDSSESLPRNLAGVEVVMDGVALPLQSVAPADIRAQLPYDIANRSSASLYIRSELQDGTVLTSTAIAVTFVPAAPGLFAFSGKEPRPGMSVHGSANRQQGTPVTPINPATPGEVLVLWGAGLGTVVASNENGSASVQAGIPNPGPDSPVQIPVSATVNGVPAEVVSATLPQGAIGIYEIRLALPANLPASGNATLAISQDGRQSNSVTIPVTNNVQ